MTFDFQSYFASIRTTYAKWWEYYTLTDATGKQRQSREASPFFDFGLMVQTVKREERDRQTEEKVERFSVLDGLRKYADQQVLLVGRPGSGKSTALARLMLEEATNQQARIPVLVELRYWQGSIEQLIHDSLIRHEMPAEQVETALKNALILFDGVNELPSEEARSQLSAFRRNHPKLPMIFTTRDLSIGGDLGIEKKLEMQPLSEVQMREFVRAYVPEQAEQMLWQLKARLRELGQTPLLLWMLCSLFQRTGTIPENLGLVFRGFTQGYEQYLKEDVRIESDKAWWKPVLQQLAWVMMQGEKPTEFRVAISREAAVRAIAQFLEEKVPYAEDFTRKCLRDLQKHHLIQAGTNQEELEFRHQLIQEYYAAEALLEQLPRLNDETLKKEYLNYLKWTEPTAMALSLAEDEVQVLRLIELAVSIDLVFGAKLIKHTKPELQNINIALLNSKTPSQTLRIRLLGFTKSDHAIPFLREQLSTNNPFTDFRVIQALGEIGSKTAKSILFEEAFRNADSDMFTFKDFSYSQLIKILGDISDETDIPHLVNLVKNLGSKSLLPGLLSIGETIDAIAKIGGDKAICALQELLNDKTILNNRVSIASSITFGLQKIGTPQAIYILVEALANSNEEVQSSALEALSRTDFEIKSSMLLEALNSRDTTVRHAAAIALGSSSFDITLPYLLDALSSQDLTISWRAAKLMSDLGKPEQLKYLSNLLQTDFRDNGLFNPLDSILEIQERCKFYNYEVYQAYLEPQKIDRQIPQNSDLTHTIINNYPNVTEVKQTIMSNSSKYNFSNAQKVQIFEQVNTYIENTHPTDPEIKKAIADLTLLLTQLQTQHPQVKTESQALTILDAEFTKIQHSTTHPLVTLRQQLLNPERHLQAIKATLAEIAKHYLEESVWSKAAITYLDKMSETPDQGA
ncbi:PBS lyase HEAT-like repeat domain protein [Leptolyngbya boryana NIES-2135]|jgi:HEAT repeat protein|uniref:PBS lyase HEAT-like repeat domain protein n=1 Tax=Leptolyngbya boryana NIES-2135 TaxID=1973484 RepID=A0A1Z4JMR3_LEPBY|nr:MULTISPECIES: HEAT repeat domain-containing protein [Leptolyngbya]BAY58055.1 PBS lyase HEAT-like repeat domain protein [Leptolyngbya boryana NIES-2135]MBD2367498.1 HEAT repeat domain-containing protein [Leptolyngbya sp. FACHB-161]MBD2374022.1 HEAT repeat domain-containing protein [Leptolyngbya sp. FACHB-238]MBD2398178.1 HEAT repeat domain-containing protein [Leptolyngbya sp. FACHB-239]MBD2404325.1 HEAT repeat domain-containing protein [Leptolyngbya sp. FACHB-402]